MTEFRHQLFAINITMTKEAKNGQQPRGENPFEFLSLSLRLTAKSLLMWSYALSEINRKGESGGNRNTEWFTILSGYIRPLLD